MTRKIILALMVSVFMLGGLAWADMQHGGHQMEAASVEEIQTFSPGHSPVWAIKGENAHLIGGYGHNFSYDGKGVKAVDGEAYVLLDAERNSGTMIAKINGTITPEKGKSYTGEIMIVYDVKPHQGPAFQSGGVAEYLYLHGDTKQGPPVMPKARTFLGSWADGDVYINGKLIYKGLHGHMMYTEGIRDTKTQAVYADSSKTTFYSPKTPSRGYIVDPDRRELHFVVHSMKKDPGNFPPHDVWIHLNFENASEID